MTAVDWEGRGLKAPDSAVQVHLLFHSTASQLLGCRTRSQAWQKGTSVSSVALSVETYRGWQEAVVEDPEIHAGAKFFFPGFCHACVYWSQVPSAWLGASLKRHASDGMDSPPNHHRACTPSQYSD